MEGGAEIKTVQIYDAKQSKIVAMNKIEKSDADWKKLLTEEQYEITTRKGTEDLGTCTYTLPKYPSPLLEKKGP